MPTYNIISYVLFSVIGTPFYLMEYVDGRLLTDPTLPGLQPTQRKVWPLSLCRYYTQQLNEVNTDLLRPTYTRQLVATFNVWV